MRRTLALVIALSGGLAAQVFSPKVLLKGQPDATDLRTLAAGIYAQAGAKTPREKAEAVWRFFLTDGRFVQPGFWYHIAGWAYEEPAGEVLEPLKLLNSYGFGLCYQIAPLLEAVWKAGGFADARVWFLTGHTVAEVFYDGGYHYFDSDMMGYNPVGRGAFKTLPVASVHQIEKDGNIILSKMRGPGQVDRDAADNPWYPADVRAAAIGDLARLFTTVEDNHLFPLERAPQGHRMDFVLRPGERIVRYFRPEREGLFYLPYKFDGRNWKEFPEEIARYHIRTADGPRSQKDERRWATGRIEYRPPQTGAPQAVYEVTSPYVIIDAEFLLDLSLSARAQSITVETSTDNGRTWQPAGMVRGPRRGSWRAEPAVLTVSQHGRRTAVSGSYRYLVRVTRADGAALRELLLVTRFQLNPRTLPALRPGLNELVYTAGSPSIRREIAGAAPYSQSNAHYVEENGQGYWAPASPGRAELAFKVSAESLTGVEAGARFLDLTEGFAPDKFTAEIRKAPPLPGSRRAASIAWSGSPSGPFRTVWEYNPALTWKDGVPIDRTLLWPEVDRHIAVSGPHDMHIRYRLEGMALDNVRLATESHAGSGASPLKITHVWNADGVTRRFSTQIPPGTSRKDYTIDTAPAAKIDNEAIIFECPAKK
jgi:hypothetical protein